MEHEKKGERIYEIQRTAFVGWIDKMIPDLPKDTYFIGLAFDNEKNCVLIKLASGSFPKVYEGDHIPHKKVDFKYL